MYRFTDATPGPEPPTARSQALFGSLRGDQAQFERFLGVSPGPAPCRSRTSSRRSRLRSPAADLAAEILDSMRRSRGRALSGTTRRDPDPKAPHHDEPDHRTTIAHHRSRLSANLEPDEHVRVFAGPAPQSRTESTATTRTMCAMITARFDAWTLLMRKRRHTLGGPSPARRSDSLLGRSRTHCHRLIRPLCQMMFGIRSDGRRVAAGPSAGVRAGWRRLVAAGRGGRCWR